MDGSIRINVSFIRGKSSSIDWLVRINTTIVFASKNKHYERIEFDRSCEHKCFNRIDT